MPLPPCPVCAASASPEEPPGPDALDTLATQALEDWPSLLRPLLHPVVAALDAALSAGETPEQFRARLPGLLERMDIGPATESLAQSGFVARLAGELGIEP
jgi:phage gp29-like protein